jgi:hypothetical protein
VVLLRARTYGCTVAGLGDAPGTPSAIDYDDGDRSKFLQDYLEVLYLSTRCVQCIIFALLIHFDSILYGRSRMNWP